MWHSFHRENELTYRSHAGGGFVSCQIRERGMKVHWIEEWCWQYNGEEDNNDDDDEDDDDNGDDYDDKEKGRNWHIKVHFDMIFSSNTDRYGTFCYLEKFGLST